MERIKLFTVLSFILFFVSCTNDDLSDLDTAAKASDLIGTWNLIEESQEGVASVILQGLPLTGTITSVSKDLNATITFSENPSVLTATGSYTETITATFATLTRTEEIPVLLNNELSQGAWSLNQGVISLSGGNEMQAINIVELTGSTLKIEIPIVRNVILEGNNIGLDTTIKMTFSKQ